MLEEPRMDKKSMNRSTQLQSRATAVDCKKNSDLPHKPLPRNNRKRESPANAPKNELHRKNTPAARGRGLDKRPRARVHTDFAVGGATYTGLVDEDEPELGSVFVPGSKKQNLNHLLNFVYSPRGTTDRSRGLPPQRRHIGQAGVKKHNLDLYLQASCQFVVKESGDYSSNLLDPDKLIDWNQIEEIVVRSTGRSECPICLGAPAAGRVGRCGHVYCWSCALHYAATHDHQPPPCPVCAAPFRVDQMKPARMVQWASPGEEVSMRLVRRLRGSTTVEIAPPRGQANEQDKLTLLPIEAICDAPYSKLFVATDDQVRNILERERKELQDQILAEIDTTEIVFIEKALALLNEQEIKITNKPVTAVEIPSQETEDAVPIVYEKQTVSKKKIDWFDETGEEKSIDQEEIEVDEVTEKLEKSNLHSDTNEFNIENIFEDETEFPISESPASDTSENLNESLTDLDKENRSKYFYFYQAEDGQQVFLHSLNVRVLNASWGALAAAPAIIRGKVLRRETSSLTDQIRKHMPCAAHLPLHCPFDIVEIELKPPFASYKALQMFSDEIERRARARAKIQQKERRRERAYKRQMEGPPKPDFTSETQFPPASHASPPLCEPSLPMPVEDNTPSTSGVQSPPGVSFAKMASTSGTWRVRATRPPTPPPVEHDDEPSAPRALSLSDAIEAALQAAPTKSAKGRNKKSKQKVLFATGMQRAA